MSHSGKATGGCNGKLVEGIVMRFPVQADLQSADLEYQHLQCEKKALLNLLKPLYLRPKQQSNAMKDTINKGIANPHTQH